MTSQIFLVRYDSQKHVYKNPLTFKNGLRYVASPEITNRLYIMPIEEGKDVVPPTGTLEKASVFYLLVSTENNQKCGGNNEIEFCPNCKSISGSLSVLSSYSMEERKFSEMEKEKEITTVKKNENTSIEEEESDSSDSEQDCFFCKAFKNGKTLAYSCFAFATSANSSVTSVPVPEAYLVSVTVAKDFRNQKLCSLLLKESFKNLQNIHKEDIALTRIRLHVRSDLPFLKRMYEKFGFVVRRNCPKYYPVEKLDAVEMLLENFDKKDFDKESGMRRER